MDIDDAELAEAINNPERMNVLHQAGLLDTPQESVFDRTTESVCLKLNVPISLVTIVDIDRQFFKSAQGLSKDLLSKRETPLNEFFCQYVVKKRSMIIIEDAASDPVFRNNLGYTQNGVLSYLGAPIFKDGQVIASICAADIVPRKWSEADIEFLEEKADFIKAELRQRDKA